MTEAVIVFDHHLEAKATAPAHHESATAGDALRSDFFKGVLSKASGGADIAPPLAISSDSQAAPAPEVARAAAPASSPAEVPQPVQQAISSGSPISFSSAGENAAANRQPDYFLNTDGQLVKNDKATPSPDGSINIQIQTAKQEDNKSLRDAITHQTEMQKEAAKDMIRLWQKDHPGQSVPGWMNDLANAKPNIPDFVPMQNSNQPAQPAPENGFSNRGTGGGHGGGFEGNGGFDGNGMFRGNGGSGDGYLNTGGMDSKGKPLGEGEKVAAKEIYDYMTQHYGLSPVVASGILGNMQTESSLKTDAYNHGEGAIGFCQWEGNRRVELEQFAAAQHKPVTDWHVQVDFMMHELQGSEKGAFAQLQQAQTPREAAAIFDKFYERSAGTSRGERMGNADNIYHQIASADTTPKPQDKPPALVS